MSETIQSAAPEIARRELEHFQRIADRIGMDIDRQSRLLHLPRDEWQRWRGMPAHAPLPASPALPRLLLQLGYLTSRLERVAASH